jgi:hypothetical protein
VGTVTIAFIGTLAMIEEIESLLCNHCLGSGDPSGHLLGTGQFPPGWVRRFDELLEAAKSRWSGEPMLPQALVAALFYASFFPEFRCLGGRTLSGQDADDQTERDMAHLRSASSLFLFQGTRPVAPRVIHSWRGEAGAGRCGEMERLIQ